MTDLAIVTTGDAGGEAGRDGNFRLVTMDENSGFGAAVNRGVLEVEGEYLLLATPMCISSPGCRSPGCRASGTSGLGRRGAAAS